jgi:protoporphyrinogen oxidase
VDTLDEQSPVAPCRRRIAVIGGGILGLTAAYRLAQQGHAVTLWEQSEQLGGQAAAFPVAGTYLEHFYHHLFMSDHAIVDLIEELGISGHLEWIDSNVGFFAEGEIYPLTSAGDLLKLAFLRPIDRLRIGLVTLYLQRISKDSGTWRKFERVTAWEWLRRAVGTRAFEQVWGAQLRAKFGPRAEEVAMVWFWNKVFLRTQSRPSLLAREQLGYIRGSFNVLIDRLAEAGRLLGVDIRAGVGLTSIEHAGEGSNPLFTLHESNGASELFDIVLATVPSPILLRLVPDMPEPYRSKLTSASYQGAVCMLLRLQQQLSSTYWLNIGDPRLPFTGIIEHTNLLGPEHYEGSHFVYVSKYVDWDHPYVRMSDEQLLDEYIPLLQLVNPDFERAWVEDLWVFRAPAAQPIIPLNYSDRLPEHRTPIPGLFLANTSQIYPEDRGTNYSVDLGNRIARLVHESIA